MNINLIFIGTGYNDRFQAYIKIYDINNNLIYEGYTYNGCINICLNKNNYYKIIATLDNDILNGVIYTNQTIYKFIFNRSYISIPNITTFILTDYNYNNLPIEKGEINLWIK